jgi:single-strand DNA-binding protein
VPNPKVKTSTPKGTKMNETTMTIAGNLVADPELRYTPQGQPVARFRVASTPRFRDNATGEWKDGEALFLTCNARRQLAENAAESLDRGSRVIVSGRLRQRTYQKDGEKRTVYELEADEIGPSLRNATAKVSKVTRTSGGGAQASSQSTGKEADPWVSEDPSGYSDEPPF